MKLGNGHTNCVQVGGDQFKHAEVGDIVKCDVCGQHWVCTDIWTPVLPSLWSPSWSWTPISKRKARKLLGRVGTTIDGQPDDKIKVTRQRRPA